MKSGGHAHFSVTLSKEDIEEDTNVSEFHWKEITRGSEENDRVLLAPILILGHSGNWNRRTACLIYNQGIQLEKLGEIKLEIF